MLWGLVSILPVLHGLGPHFSSVAIIPCPAWPWAPQSQALLLADMSSAHLHPQGGACVWVCCGGAAPAVWWALAARPGLDGPPLGTPHACGPCSTLKTRRKEILRKCQENFSCSGGWQCIFWDFRLKFNTENRWVWNSYLKCIHNNLDP